MSWAISAARSRAVPGRNQAIEIRCSSSSVRLFNRPIKFRTGMLLPAGVESPRSGNLDPRLVTT